MDIIKKKTDVNTLKLKANIKESDYVSVVENALLKVRPFVNYMSEVLTTNENGEPLY